MRAPLFLVVCLTGCGLTLDLDEPVDASVRDVPGSDVRGVDSGPRDSGATVTDATSPDAVMPDAGISDGGDEGLVEPADVGVDAFVDGCEDSCGAEEICVEGVCVECMSAADCVDPEGAGCVDFTCSSGECVPRPQAVNEACEYCDPASGEVYPLDNDGDGFPPCPSDLCSVGPEICDCDDEDFDINPMSFDLPGLDRNCDDDIDITDFVCAIDVDEDGAIIIGRLSSFDCEIGERATRSSLIDVPLDCDDSNINVTPEQMDFFSLPVVESCTRPQCFDYNCDRRQEREFPAFAIVPCERVSNRAVCNSIIGWASDGSGSGVPACGEPGELIECNWNGSACESISETYVQHCR